MSKENLFLCMGSACHQLGVYIVQDAMAKLVMMHLLWESMLEKEIL
jgi:hypothetical protein